MKHALLVIAFVTLVSNCLMAQFRPVAPGQMGERLVAIVPMVTDPVKNVSKPLFVDLEGVTSYKAIVSDDGRWALVEVVAKTRKALAPALTNPAFALAAAGRAGLPVDVTPRIVFRHDGAVDAVLADFAKLKRGFRAEHFGVGGR